jgi:hypothetical protein
MGYYWELGQKLDIDFRDWECKEIVIKPLRHIIPAFYPTGMSFQGLIQDARRYETSMEAFAVVYYGRASQCIGQPYSSFTAESLGYTGYEGWLEGTAFSPEKKIKIIANAGHRYKQRVIYHLGGDKNKERIEEYYNIIRGDDLQWNYPNNKAKEDFIIYSWLLHNYLFNQSREIFKHIKNTLDTKGLKQYNEFYNQTHECIEGFPQFHYDHDPVGNTFSMIFWLPKKQLALCGKRYPVNLSKDEMEGYQFFKELKNAGLPPIAAVIERWKIENPYWMLWLRLA